jgi:hypothetical protein
LERRQDFRHGLADPLGLEIDGDGVLKVAIAGYVDESG